GAAHTLGFALAVSGAAGLGLAATHQADTAIAPHLGAGGNNIIGRNAASITAGAAAVVGAGLMFHQPAKFVGEASRVTAAAQKAFANAPADLLAAAKGGPGAPALVANELLATVSGGANSTLKFDALGKHGQEFVSEAISGTEIQRIMGEGVDPLRAYASLTSAPTMEGRVDALMAEAEKLGYFDGKIDRVVIATATGSGFIDPPSIQAAEIAARGKIGTLAIQYNNAPSVITQLQGRTKLGAHESAMLMKKVNERIQAMPTDLKKPVISLFGESLGALAQHQSFGAESAADMRKLHNIDSSLWVGVPFESKFEARAIAQLGSKGNPGDLQAFDRIEDYEKLAPAQRDSIEHLVLAHDNDAVHTLDKKTIWFKRPAALNADRSLRPAGVPTNQRYIPGISGFQGLFDLLNGTHPTPGKFEAYSHDYRADLPEFVRVAYGHDVPGTATYVNDAQVQGITQELVNRELLRTGLANQLKAAAVK
ncbi:MAG: alpha/beta-hydrolase family protein, partial [Thermoleophilia bacterium]|nr:alpha/beta-hydrolase family protein [Thermoleophilia bacterium]